MVILDQKFGIKYIDKVNTTNSNNKTKTNSSKSNLDEVKLEKIMF